MLETRYHIAELDTVGVSLFLSVFYYRIFKNFVVEYAMLKSTFLCFHYIHVKAGKVLEDVAKVSRAHDIPVIYND